MHIQIDTFKVFMRIFFWGGRGKFVKRWCIIGLFETNSGYKKNNEKNRKKKGMHSISSRSMKNKLWHACKMKVLIMFCLYGIHLHAFNMATPPLSLAIPIDLIGQ